MKIESPHSKSLEEIKEKLETDPEKGLTSEEAGQRLEEYGPNKLEEKEEVSVWKILLDQVNTPVVYLLGAAAALSFAFGDLPEGIFIVVVILVNAVIGFWMEYQAKQSMSALQEMDKLEAKVIRDGEQETIDAEKLVPGDLLVIEPGDMVPADARLIETKEAKVNEAALTGESVPVTKETDEEFDEDEALGDRTNMVYKGTAMTQGKAKAVVVGTGMDTEIGSISEMVQSAEGNSIPLDKKLHKLTKKLIWIVLGMAAVLGLVSTATDRELYTIVQTAIAWAIAAIPEGLPIVASIALARGMLRLADHNVIVKKLSAVEALGETNVIFSDKTGTLTENRLSVRMIADPEEEMEVGEEKDADAGISDQLEDNPYLQHLFRVSVLANDAEYEEDAEEEDEEGSTGDPLEIALLRFASGVDRDRMEELRGLERVAEDPFDSDSMMQGTIYKVEDKYYMAAKGAASALLDISTHILTKEGEVEEMSDETRENWQKKNDELSERGLRTLAFGFRESDEKPEGADDEDFLKDLTFIGLIGFIDPPSKDVQAAIETCHDAGIQVVMVTGDHPGTALNVAEQISLVDGQKKKALKGKEIQEQPEEEMVDTSVFSRVDPGEKLDIIAKFQDQGKTVGMTGDGVNDAPALKKADIGIAMGQRGTQVAKETADLVLQDDSFPSIIHAIREGRIVFSNIRKFIVYQLSYHLGEILVIAVASFSVFQLPLLPLQLLFLNLLTDVFPALALGIGEGREDVMKRPPKDPDEPILHKKSWVAIGVYAVVIAAFVSGAYLWARFQWDMSFDACNDIAFFSLAFAQLLHAFDMRDHDEPWFGNQVTRNKWVWMAIGLCATLLMVAYFVPGLRELLSFELHGTREWILIGLAAVLPILTIQVLKSIFKLY